ncbi:N-acetylneuraminate synthase family protein [Paenibacillus oenotherae]|uniref:N-acetylneuraminate synthase family protein n=1 Tax=Paenibacillus oenotherae TaxID=1435645 RepID=A0ABS7D4W4_9BACL|nr:N-acetylneuraminate synthase family protein [Paenibacillus oenotherae]MBW7474979.1 N-acetylneuraminate synthase family protein [Paenibacillus oenotherae]
MSQQSIKIGQRTISLQMPTYFIADVASNHDGDIERAKELIWIAKEAGADAVKFQHFKASKIVSDVGFRNMKVSHQASWTKSVYEVYQQYECNRDWTEELVQTSNKAQIEFMTTPYDTEAIELLEPYIPAFKIGSGDITWISFIEQIAKINKPVLIATGASTQEDVDRAVEAIRKWNNQIILMQCNTNYTGSLENMKYVNLNVLRLYADKYPDVILGLSDHTPGHATVLGAIALGARVIEKHLTDDNNRIGPDHAFSMNPVTWRDMVERSRELEAALGDGIKRIEPNESETAVVQRRCLRLTRDMQSGEILQMSDLEELRPAPIQSFPPYKLVEVLGKRVLSAKKQGDELLVSDVIS